MSQSNDSRGYHENTELKGVDVGKLIRENATDMEVLSALRSKYPNDVDAVNRLFSEYEEKMSKVRRKAQRFATLIFTKYSTLSPKRILEKAKKYKKKYVFTDDEFNAFINIALSEKSFRPDRVSLPNTPLSKTLGFSIDMPTKMAVKSTEFDILQEILNLHSINQHLHATVIIQALEYKDDEECKLMIDTTGNLYDSRKDNMYSNVHPVLFALFAPKIASFEERMLFGSIAAVVEARHKGTQFKCQADWFLYDDLIRDPNESVCLSSARDSPMVDLRNRVVLQVELWKAVRDLRMGKFYGKDNTQFMFALKNCKNNLYDSPDMAWMEDEGSVLRRLLGVFSFRPTLVAIQSHAINTNSPNGVGGVSMMAQQISTIPIINVRIPLDHQATAAPIDLTKSLSASDFYVENKLIVPKVRSVVYSRGVVLFYINRRSYNLEYSKLMNRSMAPQFNILPFTMTGSETMSEAPVDINNTIDIGASNDKKFNLKSAVIVNIKNITLPTSATFGGTGAKTTKYIAGSSAIVFCQNEYTSPIGTPAYTGAGVLQYDPLNVENNKVTPLKETPFVLASDELRTKATIVVYVADKAPTS